MDAPQIFNIRIFILSWPWDLFESRFFITLAISSVVKRISAKNEIFWFVSKCLSCGREKTAEIR